MKIWVKDQKSRLKLWLWLPNFVVFNRLTAYIIPRFLNREGEALTSQQLIRLFCALHSCGRILKNRPMVEVKDHNGDEVSLWL